MKTPKKSENLYATHVLANTLHGPIQSRGTVPLPITAEHMSYLSQAIGIWILNYPI
jgi:hypothetical protein